VVPPSISLVRWRLRSRAAATADVVTVAAGATLYLITAVDNVVTWPSDRVLLSEHRLSRVAAVLLLPSWLWLFASLVTVFGVAGSGEVAAGRRIRERMWSGRALRRGLAVAALVGVTVVTGGFVVGAAKGSGYVVPDSRHEVLARDLKDNQVTWMSPEQYVHWQARFVREDGMFTLFGLALVAGGVGLLRLRPAAESPDWPAAR
jgi:MFS family permease